MTSKQAFLNATTRFLLCTRSKLKGGITYVRTCSRVRVCVQSTWWEGGLIIKANIPVQELEGQRGEEAYFWDDTVHVLHILVSYEPFY